MNTLYTQQNFLFCRKFQFLNYDLNVVNYLQKLKKFMKYKVKFSRLLNGDEKEEFNQIKFFNQVCSKTRLCCLVQASACCEFTPNVAILIFQIWYSMEMNVQTLCTVGIIGSYMFQPLRVSAVLYYTIINIKGLTNIPLDWAFLEGLLFLPQAEGDPTFGLMYC